MVLGSEIRDPGSGKNLFRIPDPGVKKPPIPDPGVKKHPIPDPGSGSATLIKRHKDVTKQYESRFFLLFVLDNRRIRIWILY
jgi:hypothetical protein